MSPTLCDLYNIPDNLYNLDNNPGNKISSQSISISITKKCELINRLLSIYACLLWLKQKREETHKEYIESVHKRWQEKSHYIRSSNSKGFEYMLLDRQYFIDISDSRVAFMTQNVSNYQHLCSCVSLFLMNHSINLIVLNYLPISKYTIRLLLKYLSFYM